MPLLEAATFFIHDALKVYDVGENNVLLQRNLKFYAAFVLDAPSVTSPISAIMATCARAFDRSSENLCVAASALS